MGRFQYDLLYEHISDHQPLHRDRQFNVSRHITVSGFLHTSGKHCSLLPPTNFGTHACPARSPDFMLLHDYLWGHMKDADCGQKLQAGEKLLQGIVESSDGIREQ